MDERSGAGIDAWGSLSRAHDLLADSIDAALSAELGLSLAEHDVLLQLVAAGGMLQMGDIAKVLIVSKSGVTRLVGKLEQQGFVERMILPQNRRATFARITDAGLAILQRSEPTYRRVLDETLAADLSATDLRHIDRILRKLLTAEGWSAPSPCSAWARQQVGLQTE